MNSLHSGDDVGIEVVKVKDVGRGGLAAFVINREITHGQSSTP